jgi:hypothetical protein
MAYLVEHATKVQRLVYLAMHASHAADDVFEKGSDPCFAPNVMSRMKCSRMRRQNMAKVARTNRKAAKKNPRKISGRAMSELPRRS